MGLCPDRGPSGLWKPESPPPLSCEEQELCTRWSLLQTGGTELSMTGDVRVRADPAGRAWRSLKHLPRGCTFHSRQKQGHLGHSLASASRALPGLASYQGLEGLNSPLPRR